jgi:hypothetical protein
VLTLLMLVLMLVNHSFRMTCRLSLSVQYEHHATQCAHRMTMTCSGASWNILMLRSCSIHAPSCSVMLRHGFVYNQQSTRRYLESKCA